MESCTSARTTWKPFCGAVKPSLAVGDLPDAAGWTRSCTVIEEPVENVFLGSETYQKTIQTDQECPPRTTRAARKQPRSQKPAGKRRSGRTCFRSHHHHTTCSVRFLLFQSGFLAAERSCSTVCAFSELLVILDRLVKFAGALITGRSLFTGSLLGKFAGRKLPRSGTRFGVKNKFKPKF